MYMYIYMQREREREKEKRGRGGRDKGIKRKGNRGREGERQKKT